MKTIAILTGGFSSESNISLKSAQVVYNHLDKTKYIPYIIVVSKSKWYDLKDKRSCIDKNNFTLLTKEKNQPLHFDAVFAALHGTPLEDGKIQGFFDLLGLPYTCSNGFVSGLTFDKQATKEYIRAKCIAKESFFPSIAASILVRKDIPYSADAFDALNFPLFVKPNKQGSSYGVEKVYRIDALDEAIQKAFKYDDEVMVEEFIEGREFTCGIVLTKSGVVVFSPTEIISQNDFFDYQAKYLGESKEITPAPISEQQTNLIQETTKKMYHFLKCKGMVRMDYIWSDYGLYLLEVNTIPGLSEQSILPQQAKHYGWSLEELFNKSLECIL